MSSSHTVTIPAVIGGQSGLVVVTQTKPRIPDADHFKEKFPSKKIYLMAGMQILACTVAVITQIIQIFIDGRTSRIAGIGVGIWCGMVYGLTGVVGIYASRKPSNFSISTFLGFSILTVVFSIILLIISSIGLNEGAYNWEMRLSEVIDTHLGRSNNGWRYDQRTNILAVFTEYTCSVIQILVSIVIGITAMIGSVYGCKAVCCRQSKSTLTPVAFAPANVDDFQNLINEISASSPPPAYVDKV